MILITYLWSFVDLIHSAQLSLVSNSIIMGFDLIDTHTHTGLILWVCLRVRDIFWTSEGFLRGTDLLKDPIGYSPWALELAQERFITVDAQIFNKKSKIFGFFTYI